MRYTTAPQQYYYSAPLAQHYVSSSSAASAQYGLSSYYPAASAPYDPSSYSPTSRYVSTSGRPPVSYWRMSVASSQPKLVCSLNGIIIRKPCLTCGKDIECPPQPSGAHPAGVTR